MVRLLVATRSRGKEVEIRRLLAGAGVELVFPADANLPESPAEESLEMHDSFLANARAKAEYFERLTGYPTVAEDSGLEVLSLGGEPGVRSRRWAGAIGPAAVVDAANNALLVRRLAGAPEARRRARYRCVAVLIRAKGAVPEVFEGSCTGTITEEPRGHRGFGYDPYFRSDELGITFGEATDAAKDGVSHRGQAFRRLRDALAAHPL